MRLIGLRKIILVAIGLILVISAGLAIWDWYEDRIGGFRLVTHILNTMAAASGDEIGTFGHASADEYHVGRTYQIRPLQATDLTSAMAAALPRIAIAEEDVDEGLEASLAAAHYKRLGRILTHRSTVAFYLRADAAKPEPSSFLRLAVFGDPGHSDRRMTKVAGRVAALAATRPLDAALMVGDNSDGRDATFLCIQRDFLYPFSSLLALNVPFYAILGNHDYKPPDLADAEKDFPLFHMRGKAYYSKTFGDHLATLFMLDFSKISGSSEETEWLTKELAKCDSAWRIVLIHYPLLASQIAHGGAPALYEVLHPLLSGPHGVDMVLSGHNHVYERRKLTDGVLHVTLGNSCESEDDKFPPDPERALGYNEDLCFGLMEIQPDLLKFDVQNRRGQTVDQFELRHGGPDRNLQLNVTLAQPPPAN